MIHVEQVPADPNDPRAAALAESLRAEHPDAEHVQHRHDDIVLTRFDEDADGALLGTTSARLPHISGTAKHKPTGRRHDDEPTQHEEEDL